jgi:hypothetical protein
MYDMSPSQGARGVYVDPVVVYEIAFGRVCYLSLYKSFDKISGVARK